MKRIFTVLAVAAMMAMMVVVMAAPAFAVGLGTAGPGTGKAISNCAQAEGGEGPLFGAPQDCRVLVGR